MLDNTSKVETPEGIELPLEVAGLVPRTMAYFIDLLIFLALYYALILVVGFLGNFGEGLFYIIFFIIYWLYPIIFEVFRNGQTPGKKALGIKVVHHDGTPISLSASFVRNILLIADFLPFFYTAGFLSMLFNKDFKRLGDMAAGTVVIYTEKENKEDPIPKVKPRAPAVVLTLDEQRSVLSLAERHQQLSQARQEELSNLLPEQLFPSKVENQGRLKQLHAFANWLRGH
ncbi:MAG: RDD family protein [Gammaproteobacteria bacterium]|nr:RDD family protein [Gammaproteobacteria bacterium]